MGQIQELIKRRRNIGGEKDDKGLIFPQKMSYISPINSKNYQTDTFVCCKRFWLSIRHLLIKYCLGVIRKVVLNKSEK